MKNLSCTATAVLDASGEALSQEALFELILNNLEDTFLLVDKDLRIILANKASKIKAQEYFGITILKGTPVLDLALPERRALLKQIYTEVLNGATKITETAVLADGHTNYLESYFKPARDSNGTIIGVLVSTKNITEKKQLDLAREKAKEELKLSEQQYKTLFKDNPLPCWIYDAATLQFVEVNNAAIRHYGFSKQEFLGLTLLQILPDADDTKTIKNIKSAKNYATYSISNSRHRIKDGRTIFVDLRITAITYSEKNCRLVVAHDVTPRVVTENELRKSNERFKLAAQASSEALWEYDFVTGEAFISAAYTDILGWHADEFRKFDRWPDYIHPGDRERTVKEYEELLEDTRSERWEKEYRYLKSDGTYAFVNDKAIILRNKEGKPLKVVGALKNITAQKKIEEELRKSNERFLLASRAASDAIYEWNLGSNTLQWGEGLQSLFGFHPSELSTTAAWEKQIHPKYLEKVSKTLDDALRHPRKKFWKEEYLFCKADGSHSYVLDRGFIVRDHSGNAVRMIGSMQDITERKAQEHLLSLERSIFESAANLELSLEEVAGLVLKGLEEIYPSALTSVLLVKDDQTVQHLSAPRLPAGYISGINGAKIGANAGSCGSLLFQKKTIIVANIETDPLWADHKDFAKEFNLSAYWSLPIVHSSGKVIGSFAVYHEQPREPTPAQLDIIERFRNILQIIMENRLSLQEIKLANERFDMMMTATHDLIWDWDLTTNTIYRDPAGLQKVYGIENNTTIETISQWLHRIHADDYARVESVITGILASSNQNNFDMEYRFKQDDENYSYVYDRGVIIRNEEGKPVRILGAAQNISERKRLERELLNNELEHQKAVNQATVETQERERTEIGKELHDNVNQVLTTTKLYLELAQSRPDLATDLIGKSSKNIISVINEIRQLSRSLMNPSIGDLGLIDAIHDLTENMNLTRKLHVSLNADPLFEEALNENQKLTVFRIIQEGVNNAIKHAKASTVLIKLSVESTKAVVIIEDNGTGFNIQTVKKGAGLKNIQNRVYLINGEHTIESAEKRGSRLIINFPLIQTNTFYSC